MFNVPIPGQSLTAEPKNAPYERPPQFVRPEESLIFMMEKLSEPAAGLNIIAMIEDGMTVEQLTKGLLRMAVANGRFTIDVATLIAPVVHEYIYQVCKENDTPCKHGWEDKEKSKETRAAIQITNSRIKRKRKESEIKEYLDSKDKTESDIPEEIDLVEEMESPRQGLMVRRGEV